MNGGSYRTCTRAFSFLVCIAIDIHGDQLERDGQGFDLKTLGTA